MMMIQCGMINKNNLVVFVFSINMWWRHLMIVGWFTDLEGFKDCPFVFDIEKHYAT